jgi:hypothetical protein
MQQLKIYQKIYDMILYGHICLKNFPKYEKHVMTADIRKSMYRLLQLTISANKKRDKKLLLNEIDAELDILRTLIRLASDEKLKYLSIKKYENWSKMLSEIGRMLGGWMKSN